MKVYLLNSSDGYCKLGKAQDAISRLHQLDATRLPFELTVAAEFEAGDAASFIEQALHKHFKPLHRRGEWFWSIPVAEFLHKAEEFKKQYTPRKFKTRNDPYEGTPWGLLPRQERSAFVLAINKLPSDIVEEMRTYAFSKTDPENMPALLDLIRIGINQASEANQ